jgi:phosphoglycolate phosphatase-like HAD superfamily hydrolase
MAACASSSQVDMRIAFDLDGVLADLHSAFADASIKLFPQLDKAAMGSPEVGSSPPDAETAAAPKPSVPISRTSTVPLTSRQTNAVWRSLAEVPDFWESLQEIEPGMIRRLAELSEERRWEMLFVTSRPKSAGRTVQRQSQRWLQHHGFLMPSVYVVHGSRGQIAKALQIDVVVDDRPENCLDVALESQAGSILVWRGQRESVPASARRMGIAVVHSVSQCLDSLVEIERSNEGGTLLDRLRRIFGLRTAPNPLGQSK